MKKSNKINTFFNRWGDVLKWFFFLVFGCSIVLIGSKYHNSLVKHYLYFEYEIQSIRIDDEAEYHIVAISKSGKLETIYDAKSPYDISIQFGNYKKPMLIMTYRKIGNNGKYNTYSEPEVKLPYGYKIETFED